MDTIPDFIPCGLDVEDWNPAPKPQKSYVDMTPYDIPMRPETEVVMGATTAVWLTWTGVGGESGAGFTPIVGYCRRH